MSKQITLVSIREFKALINSLSTNVKDKGKGVFTLWTEGNNIFFYSSSDFNRGYFWTTIKERWVSNRYTVLRNHFLPAVNLLPDDGEVTLTFDDDCHITLRSSDGGQEVMSFSFRGGHAPKIEKEQTDENSVGFDIPKELLGDIRKKVLPCVASPVKIDDFRKGVGFIANGSGASVNATNFYTTAEINLADVNLEANISVCLAPEVMKVSSPLACDNIHYTVSDKTTMVSAPQLILKFQNFSYKLPNYRKEMDKFNLPSKVRFEKEKMSKILKGMDILASLENSVPVELHFLKEHLFLYTENKDFGYIKMTVPYLQDAPSINGKAIAFDYNHFIKAVNASEDVVEIHFAAPDDEMFAERPAEFITSTGNGNQSRMMVCPVRVPAFHSL